MFSYTQDISTIPFNKGSGNIVKGGLKESKPEEREKDTKCYLLGMGQQSQSQTHSHCCYMHWASTDWPCQRSVIDWEWSLKSSTPYCELLATGVTVFSSVSLPGSSEYSQIYGHTDGPGNTQVTNKNETDINVATGSI